MMQRSGVRVAVGLACAAGAALLAGTLVAGLLWNAALAVACLGYGGIFDRLARRRWSTSLTMVSGFAVLLGVSTLLGHVGLLSRPVQIAAVLAGIASCLLADTGPTKQTQRPWMLLYVLAAAAFVIVVELLACRVSFEDAFHHVLYVKRLWDTGSLGVVHHQIGLQVVGESYVSLMSGAGAAETFELGSCVALLVYLVAGELDEIASPMARPLALLLTLPVVLWPAVSVQWSGVVLHVAAFIALQRALDARVRGWHACLVAVALALLRHEYILVAVPYLALALKARWSRRDMMIAIAVWFVALIPFQIALAVPVGLAVLDALVLVAAVAIVVAVRTLIARDAALDALAALVFASVTYGIALLLDAIRPAQHGDGAVITVCFGGAAAACWLFARHRDVPTLHVGAAAAILAMVVGYLIIGNGYGGGPYEASLRFMRAAVSLRQTLVFGAPHDLEDDVAALQARVPRGARIGFWGESPGKLDFRRNRISDLSRGDKRTDKMAHMTVHAVHGVDYVILENELPPEAPDRWYPPAEPSAAIRAMLEQIGSTGGAILFRVRH